MEPSDSQLIRDLQQGDRGSLAVLARRYQSALLRVAESRLGRRDWAEEVVQETLLAALRWRMSYKPGHSVRTWLWTILLNQCRRHYRLARREPHVANWSDMQPEIRPTPTLGDALAGREPSPSGILLARERSQQLERLLALLDEPQADALRLRFFGGLKFREIADTLGCSLATAKNRVRQGLERMAEIMAEQQTAAHLHREQGKQP